jgi:hypothetical protein
MWKRMSNKNNNNNNNNKSIEMMLYNIFNNYIIKPGICVYI